MTSLVICEKPSQARSIRAAVGSQYGEVLSAVGHILTLKEPNEVREEWAGAWAPGLLWPGGFYEKKVSPQTKQYFDAIKKAARTATEILIATDCDREGQLIGGEIVEFLNFQGKVYRVIFNAEDPKSLREAFAKKRPNEEFRGLYDAGRAREQADQASNLSLTRTATVILKAPGSKGAIGIGRVKSPVLGIVCKREDEIINFKPQDYFEVDASVTAPSGSVTLSCARLPASLLREQDGAREDDEEELDENDAALEEVEPLRGKILKREIADALATAVKGASGPLRAKAERKRQGPPKLFDLTALQSAASAKFGWAGDKTLSVAQKLYSDRTLITYPRGEAKHLPENNIADVPALTGALLGLQDYRGHARLLASPVIRKGASGHFSDKALEGFSHYAIIPNANTVSTFGRIVPMLDGDESRLFDLIARQYLAAMSPDHEYRQTTIEMDHDWKGHTWTFRTSGRVPLVPGWKEILGGGGNKNDDAPELPPIKDGETGQVTNCKVRAVTTKPPARYTEGSLIRVMQEAWRLVPPGQLRDRLREAKGIGTPATRGEVVKGLKRQDQIVEKGKSIMPTPGGMALWRMLNEFCPNIVDPGRTALWETLFDAVEKQKITPEQAVQKILGETVKEIDAIVARKGDASIEMGKASKPTDKMVALARSIAERKNIQLPRGVTTDSAKCRAFLDEHMPPRAEGEGPRTAGAPGEKQLAFARSIAERSGVPLPEAATKDARSLSAWIDKTKGSAPPRAPTDKQLGLARRLAEENDIDLPANAQTDMTACSAFIDKHMGSGTGKKRKVAR